MKTLKRLIGVIMVLTLLPCTKAAADTVPPLPAYFTDVNAQVGTQAPFKPAHKYASMQNPPDFTWPAIKNAEKYDLIVCSDEALKNIKYSAYGLKYHYYNFRQSFEAGTYYWAVRYYLPNNATPSVWSVSRRFRLDPDASEFVVPENMSDITGRVPKTHPRIWMTQETIGDFRNFAGRGSNVQVLGDMLGLCNEYIKQEPVAEPLTTSAAVNAATKKGYQCQLGALCYILTDNTDYADYAVKTMLELCGWGTSEDKSNPSTTSFTGHDQAYYEILLRLSMSYDWMYNYMTSAQRTTVKDTLVKRFSVRLQADIDTLRKEPYNSHIWSYFGYYGTACMALLYDVDGIDSYFEQMLELYLPSLPPMSFEDGGWSKGTAYWTYAFTRDKWFMDILKIGGYADCYKKAWAQNEAYWAMYMMPSDSYGSFGDESNQTKPGSSYKMGLTKLGKFTGNKSAYWARNKAGTLDNPERGLFDLILFADVLDEKGEKPTALPNSHVFVDQGMTAMHSSLTNDERISLYFRSGKYGSYNHMHADQNSFFIEAYGERLAIKSGYYDSYHSAHDSGFTRTTLAHNSITYDGGKGQQDDNMNANGNTKLFVTHHDFDTVTGDATRAYNYTKNGEQFGLNNAERNIIYLRPDIYIITDNLKAKSGTQSSFEWGFNAPYNTLSLDGINKASVVNNSAKLDLEILYPQSITNTGIMRNFEDLSGIEHNPAYRYNGALPQDRVYFKTERTEETKIAALIQVHKTDDDAKNVDVEYQNGYIALSTDDGTHAIVNTGGNSGITAGGISFKGEAVIYNTKSIMLVNGTELSFGGKSIFKADRAISAVVGKGQLSISSDDDMNIEVGGGTAYTKNLSAGKLRDDKGRSLSDKIGIEGFISGGGSIRLKAQKGHYMLLTDYDSVINTEQLIPTDLTGKRKNESTAEISWTEKPNQSYDLIINGTEYKNVSSPYIFNADKDSMISASVRVTAGNLTSGLSEPVYIYPYAKLSLSNINIVYKDKNGLEIEKAANEGSVYASIGCYNGAGSNAKLVLAEYNRWGRLINTADTYLNNGGFETISTPQLVTASSNSYKAFVINGGDITPLIAASEKTNNAGLSAILLDGRIIDGFDPEVSEYDAALDESGEIPVVKGVPEDGSAYVTVRYDDAESTAVVTSESAGGAVKTYTIRFHSENEQIIPPVSDFKQIVGGMTYSQYCEYIGAEPLEGYDSKAKIPKTYKLFSFTKGGNLCGENSQRKILSIDKRTGIENCYFIGPAASFYQTLSSAPWIVSAFTGAKVQEGEGEDRVTHDLGSKTSVPWFSFKVNRDCNVIILSGTKPKFCENEDKWVYTRLSFEAYKAQRIAEGMDPVVGTFKNMYTRSYKAGETVELCNDASGNINPGIPYLTLIKFD